jgi:hypothetical protein
MRDAGVTGLHNEIDIFTRRKRKHLVGAIAFYGGNKISTPGNAGQCLVGSNTDHSGIPLLARSRHLSQDGAPLWSAGSVCRVRRARPEEIVELLAAKVREKAEGIYDEFLFAFLIPVDLRAN